MYPQPPLLIRRALEDDILPKGSAKKKTFIPRGTDIFISTWNMHRSPEFWHEPDKYNPERFMKPFRNPNPDSEWGGFKPGNQMYPNEVLSDYAFIPFGAGSRKCVGDQFAMMESIITIVFIMQRFDLTLARPAEEVGMKTGQDLLIKLNISYTIMLMVVFPPHPPPSFLVTRSNHSHCEWSANAS
jgi:cytochrome P450